MADTCSACDEPLLVLVESDSEVEDTGDKKIASSDSVPDDVELLCGCHFHWECFLDAYTITQCPHCGKEISSLDRNGQQQVLCTVRNEGGEQQAYDILPTATEEAYLRAYPEERRSHAFLEFCREGDLDAIIHLIKDDSEVDAVEEDGPTDVLRYQGTFEGIEGSALHVAVRYMREEVAWLLLAMASPLDWSQFPAQVFQAMEGFGLTKGDRRAMPDIRTLRDENGRTPGDLAQELGGLWTEWISSGRLSS